MQLVHKNENENVGPHLFQWHMHDNVLIFTKVPYK
jgi:hypothetical protein